MTEPTGMAAIFTAVSTLITNVLQWCTSITTWILGDDLAVMFFAIMFLMLAIHVINSLVHQFS